MPTVDIFQIDAFADTVFRGNPAAVCPLDAWLPDDLMQAIAAENNLSETAFFVASGDGCDLRWFTLSLEVDLCGHATLASAFLILTRLSPGSDSVRFDTRSGGLHVTRDATGCFSIFPPIRAKSSIVRPIYPAGSASPHRRSSRAPITSPS